MPTRPLILAALLAAACSGDGTPPQVDKEIDPPETPRRWKAFDLGSLRGLRASQGVGFLEFLTEGTLRMGLYHLPAGATDTQDAHGEDEVYYVAGGSAVLSIGGVDHDAETGSAFFVKAGVDHRFHSITEDLDVLVVFRRGPTGTGGPTALAYSMEEMVSSRTGTSNVWNLFLEAPTMSLGMYMLPSSVGGDGVLTHTFDEINIVVRGRSRFVMGSDSIDLVPGSIVYVEDGLGHTFRNLTEDVDVLILWQR